MNNEVNIKKLPINQRHKIDIDKQVDDKGRPERFTAIGHITEQNTGEQAADGLHFRLTDMQQDKRNHLDKDAAFFKLLL